ncbi:MAG: Rnf-Nqr domain containing protein [Phycisphaerae bacterium]|nr:Rnf-Nqr domain containing protein [Phycisphaerae bacterium]
MPGVPEQLGPRKALLTQLWVENPVSRQVLGICSALAVTNRMFNTLLMCGGLIWATSMSALTLSLMRNWVPKRVRIMVSVLIAAVFVIVVDIVFRAYFTEVHKDIAAYVGLIITNCIVLGRMEAFSGKNPPLASLADGFGAGMGYSFMLMAVATVREVMGFGTVFGYPLLKGFMEAHQAQWVIMIMPPGAFFVLAILVWLVRWIDLKRAAAKAPAEPPAAPGARREQEAPK